tara:strand:- start:103 stop:855 length:753 start_codon:yes stop_codon:yes gene_type:complete
MALGTNELFASRDFSGRPRMVVERNKVATLGPVSGAPEMPIGTPLSWDSSASKWAPLTQPSDAAIFTITANATPASAGAFVVQVDGLSVTALFDVTAAALATAINAMLLDAGKDYTVAGVATAGTDLGDANAIVTLTFSENAGAPTVALDVIGLTGNVHVLATSDAGTQINGTDEIAGFLAHQKAQSSASDDVQITVMLAGEVHRDDINTALIRAALLGSPSEAEVDTALKSAKLRQRGITVRGLAAVEG